MESPGLKVKLHGQVQDLEKQINQSRFMVPWWQFPRDFFRPKPFKVYVNQLTGGFQGCFFSFSHTIIALGCLAIAYLANG